MPKITRSNSNIVSYAADAQRHLRAADPMMARMIDQIGSLEIRLRAGRFASLARAIIFQQLGGHAAQAIHDRVVALFPGVRFPTPALILATEEALLRSAGLSRGKVVYLKDLARHLEENSLDFRRLKRKTDEEAILELTRVRGIGRWTAEIFLIFNLGRPDVFPADDLVIRNTIHKAYKMRDKLTPKQLTAFAERWRPFRSAAAWYLWRYSRIIAQTVTPDVRVVRRKSAGKAG